MGSVELAILKAAQTGGYLDALPEDSEDIIKEAHFYLAEATKAYEDGMKGDKTIKEIMNLGKKLNYQTDGPILGSDEVMLYRGLPIPEDLHGEPTKLPEDFTQLSPKEIMRLHSIYNAYAARARWMLAIATNKMANVTHLRDAEYRRAYSEIHEANSEKKLTQPLLDAAARNDPEFIKLNDRVKVFTEDVTTLKALTEIYYGNVDRLSREWTMRQDEDKRY